VTIVDNDTTVAEVTLSATDANAAEENSDPGTFRISRGTETSGNLTVNYTVGGTASSGDYSETLGGSATITDGNTYVDITITPIDDSLLEDPQTVSLTLASGTGYTIGSPASDTVTIADNDTITENFESGDGTGGTGWSGNWNLSNFANITDNRSPRDNYHLLLTKDAVATRTADLSEVTDADLSFYWKADSLESGEYATVEIYDGTSWQEILYVDDTQDDDLYHYVSVDLSTYTLTADFAIRVSIFGSNPQDFFSIDDILLTPAA
jgi:hypothetical protein